MVECLNYKNAIREQYETTGVNQKELAKKHSMSVVAINKMLRRKTYTKIK